MTTCLDAVWMSELLEELRELREKQKIVDYPPLELLAKVRSYPAGRHLSSLCLTLSQYWTVDRWHNRWRSGPRRLCHTYCSSAQREKATASRRCRRRHCSSSSEIFSKYDALGNKIHNPFCRRLSPSTKNPSPQSHLLLDPTADKLVMFQNVLDLPARSSSVSGWWPGMCMVKIDGETPALSVKSHSKTCISRTRRRNGFRAERFPT